MADSLYLSLWFPNFAADEMLPRTLAVLKQFPYSTQFPGIGHVEVHPVGWDQPSIFEETFDYRAEPERVIELAAEFLHEDYAYEFEALWDLWTPSEERPKVWIDRPQRVSFVAQGLSFDEGSYRENGHVLVDCGLDTPFLFEDIPLTSQAEAKVKANVQKLVGFTSAVEKDCGISGRLLWSESEENLAQKLIARLQRVQ
ncbi:MAG TPA: hypothetical protein VMS96_10290 [Terriglobales bacterium]|nr:hypothetical protein [Terriglobales bacterium]